LTQKMHRRNRNR